MLKLALGLSAFAAVLAAPPLQAQTFDPSYPVCLHVFGELEGERMDCIFNSMSQCRIAATGRPAMCLINPYLAQRQPTARRRY